jgi:flagellar hook-associated protein 3 FlgL
MARNLMAMERAERQISSGRRFDRPGEAPEAAARVLRIERKLGDIDTYRSNLSTGRGMIGRAEAAVLSLTNALNAGRELALQMADSFFDGERVAQVPYAEGLIDTAINLLNTTYDDMHLFGGNQSSTPPFGLDGNGDPQYIGDSGLMELDGSEGARSRVTIDPDRHFTGSGGGENVLQLMVDLRNHLANDDQASISGLLDRFQTAIHQMSSTEAELGTLYQRLQIHDGINEVQEVELMRLQSEVEDTDFAEAASTLMLRQTAYQANLAATARVQGLSLLNFMR